jgi:hypothetical protein
LTSAYKDRRRVPTLWLVENGIHVVWAARGSNYANGEITLTQNVEPAPRKALVGLKPT